MAALEGIGTQPPVHEAKDSIEVREARSAHCGCGAKTIEKDRKIGPLRTWDSRLRLPRLFGMLAHHGIGPSAVRSKPPF
jgi:hypothetical protein